MRFVTVGLVTLLGAVAGLQFQRVFGVGPVLVPVLVAAVGAAASATVSGVGRDRAIALDLLVTLVLMGLVCPVLVAAPGAPLPTAAGMRTVADGVANGWARILSSTVPVPAQAPLLVLVPVTTWLATWFSVELVRRTRAVLGVVLPPLLVFLLATFLGVGGAGNTVVSSIAFGAVALVFVGARSADIRAARRANGAGAAHVVAASSPSARWRVTRSATGLAAVAVTIVAVLAAAPLLAALAADPADPREDRELPLQDLTSVNPLAALTALQRTEPVPALRVSLRYPAEQPGQASSPARLRLAVLDRFDGTRWTASGRFVVAGANLTPAGGSSLPSGRIPLEQAVTVLSPLGVWLPAADLPVRLDADAVRVDPSTGVLVREEIPTGFTYSVTSHVLADPAAALHQAPASGPDSAPLTGLPGAPPALVETARGQVEGETDAYGRLLRLEEYLRQPVFEHTAEASTGHSYGHLTAFLTESHQGGDEQFAATFAVMARSLGYPTRIAVGYVAPPGTGAEWTATSRDLHAWPEVEFAGVGWVPFQPFAQEGMPSARDILDRQAEAGEQPGPDPSGPGGAVPPTTVPAPEQDSPGAAPGPVALVLLAVAGGLVVTAAGLAALAWRRRRRTAARRDAASPRDRVIGAWHEVLDLLDTAYGNGRDTTTMTTSEVAALSSDRVGTATGARVAELGALADIALYDARGPDRAAGADAWSHAEAFQDTLVAAVPRGTRWRILFLPRRPLRDPPEPVGAERSQGEAVAVG